MSSPYPLNEKLPVGVFNHREERLQQYINYPVFSWEWFWRRAAFFGPFGFIFGAVQAMPLGLAAGQWPLAWEATSHMAPAWAFIMVFGTALGTWVRHRGFTPRWEKRWLFVAVLLGIGASYLVKHWFELYLESTVRPALLTIGTINAIPFMSTSRGMEIFYEGLVGIIIVSVSGGRALRNYYTELRRWRLHGAQAELQGIKRQRDDADRKLTVLQAQIEPHFLYNTLASVRSLVRSDPVRAEATIDALVDHLRATLPRLRGDQVLPVSLGNQLEICRSYLDVMRVRMGGRLSYSIDASADVKEAPFPPLMLVPLVENAIKHGVERKPGPCSLAIRAIRAFDGGIEVTVADDGAGLREGPSDGVGIANIREQLQTRYGDRASIELSSRAGGGTLARVFVPVELQPQIQKD